MVVGCDQKNWGGSGIQRRASRMLELLKLKSLPRRVFSEPLQVHWNCEMVIRPSAFEGCRQCRQDYRSALVKAALMSRTKGVDGILASFTALTTSLSSVSMPGISLADALAPAAEKGVEFYKHITLYFASPDAKRFERWFPLRWSFGGPRSHGGYIGSDKFSDAFQAGMKFTKS